MPPTRAGTEDGLSWVNSSTIYCRTPETWFGADFQHNDADFPPPPKKKNWVLGQVKSQSYKSGIRDTARVAPPHPNRIALRRCRNKVSVFLQKKDTKSSLNPAKVFWRPGLQICWAHARSEEPWCLPEDDISYMSLKSSPTSVPSCAKSYVITRWKCLESYAMCV